MLQPHAVDQPNDLANRLTCAVNSQFLDETWLIFPWEMIGDGTGAKPWYGKPRLVERTYVAPYDALGLL